MYCLCTVFNYIQYICQKRLANCHSLFFICFTQWNCFETDCVYCNVQYSVTTLSTLLKLICYHSIHIDQMLMLPSAVDSDQDSVSPGSLQFQNKERVYRQRLQVYQEAQQRQAQLVQKLQTKVTRNGPRDSVIVTFKKSSSYGLTYVCFTQGSSVQEEVWGTRRAGAGEDLWVWEDEIVGTSRIGVADSR